MAESDEARAFAHAFLQFMAWAQEQAVEPATEALVALLRHHLGRVALDRPTVSAELPPFEHVNLQVALDVWTADPARHVVRQGLVLPSQYGPVDLQSLLHADGLPPVRLSSSPELVDLPAGPDRTLACLKSALLLVEDRRGRYVVFLRSPTPHEDPVLNLEVAGLEAREAQEVLRELARLRLEHSVHRGQVLELRAGPQGATLEFLRLPPTPREDLVLPEAVLRRVERHTLGVARQREALRAAGQHLKRGLLLHGPPGTGKTLTTRYVVGQLAGTTALVLSGRSLHLVGQVAQFARDLAPAVVVLEDVDLVAEDRDGSEAPDPVLFELLDVMDGVAGDADLLFLLTTNRADLLEPALAARPGRVDVAVEIGLPDADARRRLLARYGRGVPLQLAPDDVEEAVARTAGVTASFVKELLRRSVLEALEDEGAPLRRVTAAHLTRALDDLLDSTQSVTRALLGGAGPGTGAGGDGDGGATWSSDDDPPYGDDGPEGPWPRGTGRAEG